MPEIALALALYALGVAISYFLGRSAGINRTLRENGAMARCAGCDWSAGPGTVAEAFSAAERHAASPEHRGIVVRA